MKKTSAVALLALLSALSFSACAHGPRRPGKVTASANAAPAALLGEFEDDYGSSFRITSREWVQMPSGKLHVVAWHPNERYLIAQNDASNKSAPNLWTRIDWVELPAMTPYAWAFCLSAYEAPTRAAAETTTLARPDTPKTGCNGFPFSRMRRK